MISGENSGTVGKLPTLVNPRKSFGLVRNFAPLFHHSS